MNKIVIEVDEDGEIVKMYADEDVEIHIVRRGTENAHAYLSHLTLGMREQEEA